MDQSAHKISNQAILELRQKMQSLMQITLPEPTFQQKPDTVQDVGISSYLDATYLSPPFDPAKVDQLCQEAMQTDCAAVCIPPYFVPRTVELLKNTRVKTCSVVDFPFGSASTQQKISGMHDLQNQGCDEIDIVLNYSLLCGDQYHLVFEQLYAIKQQAKNSCIKIIVETAYLNSKQLLAVTSILEGLGFDFIKTSTGFAPKGAQLHDIQLIKKCVENRLGIKASGGIRSLQFATQLIEAGATRIGTSKAAQIVNESQSTV